MDEIRIWKRGNGNDLAPLDAVPRLDAELELEDLLIAHPDLLESGLQLVGRQLPAAGGRLDLLGVDADGRLVIFELKRGALGRDAVTQMLDYASAVAAMDLQELVEHIGARTGQGGVQRIADFANWYEANFGDLQGLLPARMALVGLGVDETALRIAGFLGQGGHAIEVITFYGFRDGDATLLARQLPVQSSASSSLGKSPPTIAERRGLLELHLNRCGLKERFEAVLLVLREELHGSVFEGLRKNGVALQASLVRETGVRGALLYFGVYAGYAARGVISISLGTILERRHADEYRKLEKRVQLIPWIHGGKSIEVGSDEDWKRIAPYLREFAGAVREGLRQYRNGAA